MLRTNFFGKGVGAERRSFSDWLVEGFRAGRDLPLLSDVLFSPLSMSTLARLLPDVLREPRRGEVLNLGSREGMSKREFALLLAAGCGMSDCLEHPVRLDELALRAPRPLDMRMDVGRFESAYRCELPTLRSEVEFVAREYA